MSDAFNLQPLLDGLHPRYPILGGDKENTLGAIGIGTPGERDLQVWHWFSSPNGMDDGSEICNTCGLSLSKQEVKVATMELAGKSQADSAWPKPLYRAIEAKGFPIYCMDRIPMFMPEGPPPLREGDEEWEDERSGLTLRGTIDDETSLRNDSSGLSRDEVREDLSDEQFREWWFSVNSRSSWSQKAFFICRWVRARLRGKRHVEDTPRYVAATDAYGRSIQIPNPRWRPPQAHTEDDGSGEGGICETCECFKPCECPEEDADSTSEEGDEVCETCECFKPCECEEVDEDVCLECGCFLPCNCTVE